MTTVLSIIWGVAWGTFCGIWLASHEENKTEYAVFAVVLFLGNIFLANIFDKLNLFTLLSSLVGGILFYFFQFLIKRYA